MKIHKTFDREELKALPSEQLDRMLHEELDKDQKDASLVLMLLNILEEREAGEPAPEPGEAWKTFVERYNTPIAPEPAPRRKSPYRWIGAVAAAIAVFFLVLFGIPKAAGHDNIFTLIASWTDDFFTLSDPDDTPAQNEYVFQTDNPGLQQVYDAVVELGITDPVVPMWVPDGYELVELKTVPTADGRKLYARLIKETEQISLTYTTYYEYQNSRYTKDEGTITLYEDDGNVYNIMRNNEKWKILWSVGAADCMLVTSLSKEQAVLIINSILE